MCRVLTYLGQPTLLADLLYNPDSSLIKQTYDPKLMKHMLNLGGFGMAGWDSHSPKANEPYLYKTPGLPFFDKNMVNLANKIEVDCLLAHIRGISYKVNEMVTESNVHPFMFKGAKISMAHNGTLTGLNELKPDLINHIKKEIFLSIKGNTDSEWIYALFLSQLDDYTGDHDQVEVAQAVIKTLRILKTLREKNNINLASPLNLFFTNGQFIVATRFVFNYGTYTGNMALAHLAYHSMWYTFGEKYVFQDGEYLMRGGEDRKSIIVSSEPLTTNLNSWLEVPEYSLMMAWREKGELRFFTHDLNI